MKWKAVASFVLCTLIFVVMPDFSFAKVLWYQTYNGPTNLQDDMNKLYVDDAGYSYVTGGSEGDFLTIKYDTTGKVVWSSRYGNSSRLDFGKGIFVDCFGYVYVSGIIDYLGSGNKIGLVKYDPNGNIVWERRVNPGQIENTFVMTMESDQIYIAASVDNDIYVICYRDDGTQLWDYRFDADPLTLDYPVAIKADSKFVYVAGDVETSPGNIDYGYIKLDRFGTYLFTTSYDHGDDYPASITVTSNQDLYMTGYSYNNGKPEIVTMKFDYKGILAWANIFAGTPNNRGRGWAITMDVSGNPIIAGGISNGSDNDFITIKYKSTGVLMWFDVQDFGYDEEAGLILVDGCDHVNVAGMRNGDMRTVTYEPNGSVLGYQRFSTVPNGMDYGYLMDADRHNNIFIGGITNSGGYNDYLLIKFGSFFCTIGFEKCP